MVTLFAAVVDLDPQKEQPDGGPRRSDESLLNRAYGCFIFLGLATLPVGVGLSLAVLHWMNFDEGSTGGSLAMLFGMALAPPLAMGIVGASIFGIWQTVRFRHRRWLSCRWSQLFVVVA